MAGCRRTWGHFYTKLFIKLLCLFAARTVFIAGSLKPFKIAGDTAQESTLLVHNGKIGFLRVVINITFHFVAERKLPLQKHTILLIRLRFNIKADQGGAVDRNHIIKAQETEGTTFQLQNMLSGLNVCVVRLGRFHRDKILEAAYMKDNADIRATPVLIILDTAVSASEKAYVSVLNAIYP